MASDMRSVDTVNLGEAEARTMAARVRVIRTKPQVDGTQRLDRQGEPERLVKSQERVRDLGEVFTPLATVQGMLDLLPEEIWAPHPSPTFLEPACGDGDLRSDPRAQAGANRPRVW